MLKRLFNPLVLTAKSTIYTYRLQRDLRASGGDIVLIYQMAKVGSTSVHHALSNTLDTPVYHTHFLSDAGILNAEQFWKNSGAPVPPTIVYSKVLRRHLARMRPVVVTMVRDPIAREISNYFQLGNRVFEALKGNGTTSDVRLEAVVNDLSLRIKRLRDESRAFVHTWFDKELKTVFGIDVYSQPFDFENGYSVFNGEGCDVVLFRLEDLDRAFQNGIHRVFGDHIDVELSRANVGSEKSDADLYRKAKSMLRIDPDICREIYATQFGRHFYGDITETLVQKWSKSGS